MENYGHLGGLVKTWGDASWWREALRWEAGGKGRHAWSVGLRTAGRLSEQDTLDPTWRSGSNLLVEKMFTVLC